MIVEPLQAIVETAFPGVTLAPGFGANPISAAESHLGVALPEALKDYFSVAGGSREMMAGNFRMLAPEKLRSESAHLIFCEEDQGLEDFGIPLGELANLATVPNPSVAVKARKAREWFSESSSLSAFLLGVGVWQAILALPEKARCKMPKTELKKVAAFFQPLGAPDVRLGGHRIGLVDRKNSLLATYHYNTDLLYVGSPREDAIEALEKRSGLDFDSL
ncbi:MAG: hypothetical protein ABI885_16505 [Gammaproteobacteria bacterium]